MARELPYFKFYTGEWANGSIVLEDFTTQGVFINICCWYWSKQGDVKTRHLKKKFPEIGIMRSIPIPQKGILPHFPSLKIAHLLEPVSDIFLTDTWLGKEPVKGFIGITGKSGSSWLIGYNAEYSRSCNLAMHLANCSKRPSIHRTYRTPLRYGRSGASSLGAECCRNGHPKAP